MHYPESPWAAVRSDRAKSGMVRRRDVHLDGETLGIPCRCSRPVCKETGRLGNVVLSGQQTDHQSAENGLGNPQ